MAFRDDLKKLYTFAGVDGENTVFLFSDTQVSSVTSFPFNQEPLHH